MEKTELYDFLKSNGCNLIKQNKSEFFGDYIECFECKDFGLKLSSSRLRETIDIYNLSDNEEVFDLALVKALIFNEKKLNSLTTLDEYYKFLKNEFYRIGTLFSNDFYFRTKRELIGLRKERAKQMFPTIRG